MEGHMINDIAVRLDLLKKRKRGAKFKYEEIKFYNDFLISMLGLYSCKILSNYQHLLKEKFWIILFIGMKFQEQIRIR